MAEFKRKKLTLSTGRQIKLFGNSMAISPSLEIGEGYAPNIFSSVSEEDGENHALKISNPFKLTPDDIQELSDYNIRLWLELKDNVRKYGVSNPKIFSGEFLK